MGNHILVVDDEKEFLFSAEIALRSAGYRVELAGDGREALEKILSAYGGTDPYDLIVLDLRMPRMSGSELLKILQRRRIAVPVIVISSFVDKGLPQELGMLGCFDVMEKPFQPQDLVKRIGRMFEKIEAPRNSCKSVAE